MAYTTSLKQIAEDAKAQIGLTSEEAFEQLLQGMTLGGIIELASSNEDSYRNSLRSAVRGFWKGELDYDLFFDAMIAAIRLFLPRAGYEGAASVGVNPADLSPAEKIAIQQVTTRELSYIDRFAQAIEKNREEGGKLGPLLRRVDLWIKRFNGLRNRIMTMAGKDQKLKWVLHPEKEHCRSCLKLDGKVKRASYWQKMDIRPQHPTKLECMIGAGGPDVCGCTLEPTEEPCSRGPLPALP